MFLANKRLLAVASLAAISSWTGLLAEARAEENYSALNSDSLLFPLAAPQAEREFPGGSIRNDAFWDEGRRFLTRQARINFHIEDSADVACPNVDSVKNLRVAFEVLEPPGPGVKMLIRGEDGNSERSSDELASGEKILGDRVSGSWLDIVTYRDDGERPADTDLPRIALVDATTYVQAGECEDSIRQASSGSSMIYAEYFPNGTLKQKSTFAPDAFKRVARLEIPSRYKGQAAYSCTGFLVGKDLLLTAAHCIMGGKINRSGDVGACGEIEIAFDVLIDAKELRPPPSGPVKCERVLFLGWPYPGAASDRNTVSPFRTSAGSLTSFVRERKAVDIALLRIETPPRFKGEERGFFAIRRGMLNDKDDVFMVHHGTGLVAQWQSHQATTVNCAIERDWTHPDTGQEIKNTEVYNRWNMAYRPDVMFGHRCDTTGGSSGAPILLDPDTVAGIHTNGTWPSIVLKGCELEGRTLPCEGDQAKWARRDKTDFEQREKKFASMNDGFDSDVNRGYDLQPVAQLVNSFVDHAN